MDSNKDTTLSDRFRVYTNEFATVHTLPNGLTVTMEQLPYLRSFSAGIWMRVGSGNETAAQNGISHFLEHLLFKGTHTRSTRELMDAIESKGGQLNAFTSRDYTCVYVRALDSQVATAIEILADIIEHSTFNDLEKERNVVLEEIASSEDIPEDHIHDLFAQQLWPQHSLGRPVAGTIETVATMGYDHVRDYYTQWYRPQEMFFSIAGNFEPEDVLAQVEEQFGALQDLQCPARPAVPGAAAGVAWHERPIAQNHICFGFPGPAVAAPERFRYDMLSSILGGGSTSRLFERIREDEGLAYSIYTFHSTYSTTGTLGVYAAVAPESLVKATELAADELRKLQDELVTDVEMESNREQLKGSLLMALESTFTRMSRLARSMMHYGRLVEVDEVIRAIDSVTAQEIQQAARQRFTQDQAAYVVLGPKEVTDFQGLSL